MSRGFRTPGKFTLEPRRAQAAWRAGPGAQRGQLLMHRGPDIHAPPPPGPGVPGPRLGRAQVSELNQKGSGLIHTSAKRRRSSC